jgi:hypothetical protein
MAIRPSITYWNRVEPSPRSERLQPGLEAAVRDPLWFLTRQWQLGEFHGEDAASPAYGSMTARASTMDGWRIGNQPLHPLDGTAPLEALIEDEAGTPDLRTAVELGQALERRLTAAGAPAAVAHAFRAAYPVPRPGDLTAAKQRDGSLVRLLRVCGARATHGIHALRSAEAAAPGIPTDLTLPPGTEALVRPVLADFITWSRATFGALDGTDAEAWRPDRLEYAFEVTAIAPDGPTVTMDAHAGTNGEFDWYAFDETRRREPAGPPPDAATFSVLPAPVRFSGMPDPRWWNFEDARFNWADIDTDRRDLARLLVVDFMLIQGTDWFIVPFGQSVGTLARIEQMVVRDVFGRYTLVRRADANPGEGRARWTMFSTTQAAGGLADYFVLPPSALRTTLDGPDLEEVRFVRDEQANMVWAVEAVTEDATGRQWQGRERALEVPDGAAPPAPAQPQTAMRYRLQTTVPVNWIPFLPVQVDAARRAVALERAAMQRMVDGTVQAVTPVGRVLQPTGSADPQVYRIREEEIARSGTRVLRAMRRTRWIDGSTHLWTARRRRAGTGEVASGLRYDVAEPAAETN